MTVDTGSGIQELLRAEITGPVDPQIRAVSDLARSRYGDSACAVLYYGSCLRRGYRDGDVVDLYLIVDRYRHRGVSLAAAVLNWVLPPNVVYLETPNGDKILRAKCAIISADDFVRGVSGNWFHSYMWARFAQPCRLTYVRDDGATARILSALEGATKTMVRETHPLMSGPFGSEVLWRRALEETYRAELRSERLDRAAELVDAERDRYARITALLCGPWIIDGQNDIDPSGLRYRIAHSGFQRRTARVRWFFRRLAGKILSVLRLMKAAFTFDDGAVYILWKIERHSGVGIELSDWQRRHPILASTTLFWRLYRKGAFK